MIAKIILILSIFPVYLFLYFIMKKAGNFKDHSLFSVTLWPDAEQDPRLLSLQKKYKKQLFFVNLGALLLLILTIVPKQFSIAMMIWTLALWIMIVLYDVPYAIAHQKMLAYKTAYRLSQPETDVETHQYTYADLSAATAKKPAFFQTSSLIGALVGCLPILLIPILQKTLNHASAPEIWVQEIVAVSLAATGLFAAFLLRYYHRRPAAVLSMDSKINQQFARIQSYQWGRFYCVIIWMTALLNLFFLILFQWYSDALMSVLLIVVTLYCLALFIGLIAVFRVIQKEKEKLISGTEILQNDDDSNWIFGMFYYNKNDSNLMVEQKVGIGTTLNLARPGALIFSVVAILGGFLLSVGMSIWLLVSEFTPISLQYEQHTLTASHIREEYQIKQEEIESVTPISELPDLSRTNGTGMEKLLKGHFYCRTENRRYLLCLNPTTDSYLVVHTTDDKWYIFSGQEASQTDTVYEKLSKELPVHQESSTETNDLLYKKAPEHSISLQSGQQIHLSTTQQETYESVTICKIGGEMQTIGTLDSENGYSFTASSSGDYVIFSGEKDITQNVLIEYLSDDTDLPDTN